LIQVSGGTLYLNLYDGNMYPNDILILDSSFISFSANTLSIYPSFLKSTAEYILMLKIL
jgi:hypothetical protein